MAKDKKRKWVSEEDAKKALKKPEPEPKKKSGAAALYGAKE